MLIEKYMQMKNSLYLCFIGYSKVLDKVIKWDLLQSEYTSDMIYLTTIWTSIDGRNLPSVMKENGVSPDHWINEVLEKYVHYHAIFSGRSWLCWSY